MKSKYDIIVIGAGAGGLGVAIGMAKFGFEVLLAEKDRDNFGGECLNSGCIPSKALLHVAEQIHGGRQAAAYGPSLEGSTDLSKVWAYVHRKQADIRAHESAEYLEREEGIDTVIGTAKFVGPRSIKVDGQQFTAPRLLVATGSKPRYLPIPGLEKVAYYTNENLFHMPELPKRLLVIGGGNIGLEMSQAFQRLGSQVTVLERHDRILAKERPEVAALVQERLEGEGIRFLTQTSVAAFTNAHTAALESSQTEEKSLSFDAVLLAAGREIKYDALELGAAQVQTDDHGWPLLDDYLRSQSNKRVAFAGDAAHNLLFSHAAELHTTVLLTNYFTPSPFKKKFTTDHFSWVTFTDPEVATFGLSEEELRKRGKAYEKLDFTFEADDRAVAADYEYGRLILFTAKNALNPRNGKILGGTIVAPQAGEMIQELIMARQQGLGVGAIFNKTYPYPTQSRVSKIALVEKFSGAIAPWIKKLMRLLYH
jgi:pyruvate/2-oxoglutarate dehydrogenase complex dihydrolipoamide dehydrogenase (E3) component